MQFEFSLLFSWLFFALFKRQKSRLKRGFMPTAVDVNDRAYMHVCMHMCILKGS